MGKKVLVKFVERNAVFEIPEYFESTEQLQYLEKEFKREFKIEDTNLDICFQRYDKEWDEYVDLRGQNCTLIDKDKLRAVVIQTLSTSKVIQESLDDSSLACHVTDVDSENDCSLPIVDTSPIAVTDTLVTNLVEDDVSVEEIGAATSDLITTPPQKRKKINKTEKDAIPLPYPFPLPNHYRSDVDLAVHSGKMTKETMTSFITSIAHAMLASKRYPTPDDYICVGRTVIKQYPFMASPAGTPYGAIVTALKNRFKEFRRTHVKRNTCISTTPKKSPKKKNPGITQSPLEPTPTPGEDTVSFERHNRMLKVEFSKTRRNYDTVSNLMDRTFALRRKAIMNGSYDLSSIFKRFPFLQEHEQLIKELDRIMGQTGLGEKAVKTWKEIAPSIIAQAHLEQPNKNIKHALDVIADFEDNIELSALLVLPSLIPDARSKVDTSKIIHIAKGCSDITTVVSDNSRLEPYLLITDGDTDSEDNLDVYLVIDKQIIDKASFINLPYLLMASFFVYNICYPKGCTNFYSLLEIVVLNYSIEKASPCVKFFLTKVKQS